VTGAFDAIDFRGIDNHRLYDEWKDGPKTFLGLTVKHFPNMFMSMGPHQAYGNIPRSIEFAVGWIAECIEYCRDHDITFIEATDKGVGLITQIQHNFQLTDSRCKNGQTMYMTLARIF
jgi:cation diffusion facilitator CzcD-associated flavoprotein CzcO